MVGREILRCDDVPLVQDFIARNGILPLVQKAVELIGELFPQLREIKLEVSLDPEESAEWLLLRVASTASLADLTSAYRRYIRKWVSETPAEKRHFVRLSYTSV
jgi:translation initiation factor 2 gamma subunit (eIF-2gamma)